MEASYDEKAIRLLFAKNLKRLREGQKLSQLTLAGMARLTHNFINDIESCNKWISAKTLAKLSAALKVHPFQFFIDEKLWSANERDIYLDTIADSFLKWVGEMRQQYPDDSEKS